MKHRSLSNSLCRSGTLLAWIIGVALAPSASRSQELTLDEIIDHEQRVIIIDRLSSDDRFLVLDELRKRYVEGKMRSALTSFCQIEPWSFGDPVADIAFQAEIFEELPDRVAVWSNEFIVADCAAANMQGSYFSEIANHQRNMETAFSSGRGTEWIRSSAENASRAVRNVDVPLLQATRGKGYRSLFPLLNVQFSAQIIAARAVEMADANPDQAEILFDQAAQLFEDWARGNPAHYEIARNGYRYENDIVFYSAFYRFLAGDKEALSDLLALQSWPAVLELPERPLSLSPSTYSQLREAEPEYIDPIFFGRLLPGAAPESDEKQRWWNTHYPTHAISSVAYSCLAENTNDNLADKISNIDECMAAYDPADWRVELASFRGSANEESRAEDEMARLLRNIFAPEENKTLEPYRKDFAVFFEDGRWVIRTEQIYTRRDIVVFREGLARVRGNPQHVFFRQSVY